MGIFANRSMTLESYQNLSQLALDTGQMGGQSLYTAYSDESWMDNREIRLNKAQCLEVIKSNFDKISQRRIAKLVGIGNTTVNRWSREVGLIFKKHTVNETFFDAFNENSAYILGIIYSDGNIAWNPKKGYYALTITACEKDKENLEKIRCLLLSTKPLLYAPKTKSFRLIVSNKNLCKKLMLFGLTPKKSLTISFPKIPKAYLSHFIRGVIDGDGNVRYVNRKRSPYFEITIASGSLDFCKGLVEAVKESVGIDAKIRKVGKNTHVIQYSCNRGEQLANFIYQDANIFLYRKYFEYKKKLEARKNG